MEELKTVLLSCAPYFRTWVTVALDSHDWFLANPRGALHKVVPVYCPASSSQSRQIAFYRPIEEVDYEYVQDALSVGFVSVYTDEKGRGLIQRWSN